MKFREQERILYVDWTDAVKDRVRRINKANMAGLYHIHRYDLELFLSKKWVEKHYILLTRLTSTLTGICK